MSSSTIEQILRGDVPHAGQAPPQAADPRLIPVRLQINGQQHQLQLEPRVSLLDALREFIGLTGTKKGCNQGACGACTVLVNGERIKSCLTFAVMHEGQDITTIEGLGQPDHLHPLQAAFIEHDGYQCGYCTPGQICSAVAMLQEVAQGDASFVSEDLTATEVNLTDVELRERMSGNICRCGAYVGILNAIREVYEQQPNPLRA
ncbi:2Fe-2S iron-sulfur cluster-binding protein [Hymenobacter sp.]|jgi:xanthine dehydrogenase YagT iron-sulfur-binding subunit|uniref:2Fe-2S iron-sulfur cluster-binding protein n=1 Tax=Hymenobacter sp. TaxID=1898978 RepID=UPI002EDA4E51